MTVIVIGTDNKPIRTIGHVANIDYTPDGKFYRLMIANDPEDIILPKQRKLLVSFE